MLKRDITYEDGEGNTVTETFYFNLNARELVNLVQGNQGKNLDEALKELENRDFKETVTEFDEFILTSYGIRSEDNKRFIKTDQLKKEFAESFAYDALFMELAADENAGSEFLMAVIPKNLKEELAKLEQINQAKTTPVMLPPLPPQED